MGLNEASESLKSGPLYDGGLLSAADQARLRALLGDYPGVRVVLLPGEDLAAYRSLWTSLNLASDTDLLLIYNGKRWEAKGFGLSPKQVSALLDAAEGDLAADRVAGIAGAVDRLYDTAFGAGWGTYALGFGGLGLVGAAGVIGALALRRRASLMAERKAAIEAARSLVDEDLADLILASDGQRDLADVHQKAEQIRDEVRRLSRSDEDPDVIRGRAEQYQQEVAVLRTRVRTHTASRT